MKKFILLLSILSLVFLSGCLDKGESIVKLDGTEKNLPEHLKGLRVDRVCIDGNRLIYVGTFPDRQTVSMSYSEGKRTENVIVVLPDNNNSKRTIVAKQIMMENDSMILIKK